MTRPLRILVAFVVAVIGFVVIVRFQNLPQESYYAPPSLYKNATAKAYGKITANTEEGFSGHLLSGSNVFYYITYEFQPPSQRITLPDGTKEHKDYSVPIAGRVRIDNGDNLAYAVGKYVIVYFDPVDPKINGVPGTLGVWNTAAGYLNPYLWWYVGILAATLILQELLRMVTRTNDFRA